MSTVKKLTQTIIENISSIQEIKKSTVASYMQKTVDPTYGMPKPTPKLKQRLAGMSRAHQRIIGKKPVTVESEYKDLTVKDILGEKTLTKPELKKREEVAQAIERDTPEMPMSKKMAIATSVAKKSA